MLGLTVIVPKGAVLTVIANTCVMLEEGPTVDVASVPMRPDGPKTDSLKEGERARVGVVKGCVIGEETWDIFTVTGCASGEGGNGSGCNESRQMDT
jgi:hypothetical protein